MRHWIISFSVLLGGFWACQSDTTDSQSAVATGFPEVDQANERVVADPQNPAAYLQRAAAYYQYEAYDQAIADAKRSLALDSNQVAAYHLLADVYLDYYNSRMAVQTLEDAVARFPQRVPTMLKLTEFQVILTQYDAALQTIERILQVDPQNADAFFWAGLIHRDQARNEQAIISFQKATELDPFLIDAWVECGKLLAAAGKPLARTYFQRATELDTMDMSARHALAVYEQEQGQLAAALDIYRDIIRRDPQYADAMYNMGLIYLEQGDLERAEEHFTLTIKVDPTRAIAYFARGNVAAKRGDTARARQDYDQALILDPSLERAQQAIENLP